MKKYTIKIDKQIISYYIKKGQNKNAPKIIFIPGLGGDYHGFHPYLKLLSKYELIFIELPGQGGASPPLHKRKHTSKNYATLVKKLAETQKWNNYILLGHSYGTAVALNLASMSPSNINKLILLAPVTQLKGRGSIPFELYFKMFIHLPYIVRSWLCGNRLIIRMSEYVLLTTDDIKLRNRIYHRDIVTWNKISPQAFVELLLDYRKLDFESLANYINCKCLVVYGTLDTLSTNESNKIIIDNLQKPIVEIIGGANHLLQLEQPERVAILIDNFIDY